MNQALMIRHVMVIAYQSAQHRKATSRNCQRDTRISERRARTRNSGKEGGGGGWGMK